MSEFFIKVKKALEDIPSNEQQMHFFKVYVSTLIRSVQTEVKYEDEKTNSKYFNELLRVAIWNHPGTCKKNDEDFLERHLTMLLHTSVVLVVSKYKDSKERFLDKEVEEVCKMFEKGKDAISRRLTEISNITLRPDELA